LLHRHRQQPAELRIQTILRCVELLFEFLTLFLVPNAARMRRHTFLSIM
jgi:hypothetical protein